LDYQTTAALASASRALKGYNNELADKSLACAKKLLEEADETSKNTGNNFDDPMMASMARGADLNAVLQLYITTKEKKYADRFLEKIWSLLEQPPGGRGGSNFGFFAGRTINLALIALPYMDDAYKTKLRDYIVRYKESLAEIEKDNPYGIPMVNRGWGGSSSVIIWAITNYYIYKAYPEIVGKDYVYKGLNYIFGCHPYSNISFVNAVGTHSKKVAYGNNRADFTTIAGGVVPGLLLLKPDFLENKDDWPFLWGENECVIDGGAWYIFLANAAIDISNK
jgi:hypothetical protein